MNPVSSALTSCLNFRLKEPMLSRHPCLDKLRLHPNQSDAFPISVNGPTLRPVTQIAYLKAIFDSLLTHPIQLSRPDSTFFIHELASPLHPPHLSASPDPQHLSNLDY